MPETAFLQFARRGVFGRLSLGAPMSGVARLLGPPGDGDEASLGGLVIWRYGRVEFTFDAASPSAALTGILVNCWRTDAAVPKALGVTGWFPSARTGEDELLGALRTAGIPAELVPHLTFDPQKVYDVAEICQVVLHARGVGRYRVYSVAATSDG